MAGGYFGNGNGKIFDVAVTNPTGSGTLLSVYLGNGDGTFAAPINYTFSSPGWDNVGIQSGFSQILAGPVTGPGKQDLVVTDDRNNLYVVPGYGDGTFQIPLTLNQVATTVSPYLNSGGTLNLALTNVVYNSNVATNTVTVLVNDSKDGFYTDTILSSTTYSVTEADELDIAGTPTVLILGSDGTAMSSTYNSSNNTFSAPVSFNLNLPSGTGPVRHLTPFTLNGNTGFAAISGSGMYVWIGNSDGTFQTPFFDGEILPGPPQAVQLGTADLNGDGIVDILMLAQGASAGQQFLEPLLGGAMDGMFSGFYGLGPAVYGSEFVIGDLNGDGLPDIVLEEPGQGLTVLLNQGDGGYPGPGTVPQQMETVNSTQVAPFPVAMAAADLNGDLLTDLVVVNGENPNSDTDTNSISVMMNEGDIAGYSFGTFRETVYPVGNQPIAAAVATVSGEPSIFVANSKDLTVSFLQGNGDGSFQSAVTFPSGGLPNCTNCSLSVMAVGTIDSSGYPGVVVAGGNSTSSGSIYVFTHSASDWTNSATYAVPAGITSMVLYGATSSGHADLVVSTAGVCSYVNGQHLIDGEIYIYPGNGDGTFGTPTKFTSTLAANKINWNPGQLAIGSLTGSVTPDLVVLQNPQNNGCLSYGAATVQPISIFSNITSGTPTETDLDSPLAADKFTGGVSGQQLQVAVTDVNADGFSDLVLAENGLIAVLPGTGTTSFGTPSVQVASSDTGALVTGAFFAKGATAFGHDAAMASSSGITAVQSLASGAPNADFSPTTVTFPLTDPGKTATNSFTLTNTGTGTLLAPLLAIVTASGAKAPEYSMESIVCGTVTDPASIALPAGASCTFTIGFTPPYGAYFPAQIEFTSNAATSNAPTTAISGTAFYQQIVLLQAIGKSGTPIAISPSTVPAGTLNTAYFQEFSAIGGSGGYTFSETGALPRGLGFHSGVLSGTPTSAGSFSITVKATDSSSATGTVKFTLVVNCPKLKITPASGDLSPATFGFIYDQAFTVTGTNGAFTWSLIPSPPAGIKFNGGSTPVATLTGTPTAEGDSSFNLSITDSIGCFVENDYYLDVHSPLRVGPPHLPAATVDKLFAPPAFTASGGKSPYSFLAFNTPPGITLDQTTNKLTGTPTLSGNFAVAIYASDANGVEGKETVTLTVNPSALPIVIAPVTLPAASAALAYSETLTATGGGGGYTFTTTSLLPNGITLSKDGLLSGTPAIHGGTYSITVTATDHLGKKGTAHYNLVVKLAPTATPVISPHGGTFHAAHKVTITDATKGAVIYYTTDGSPPTTKSKVYKGSFTVSATETVKAIAITTGLPNSAIATVKFTII
jgi:hypothetical protein